MFHRFLFSMTVSAPRSARVQWGAPWIVWWFWYRFWLPWWFCWSILWFTQGKFRWFNVWKIRDLHLALATFSTQAKVPKNSRLFWFSPNLGYLKYPLANPLANHSISRANPWPNTTFFRDISQFAMVNRSFPADYLKEGMIIYSILFLYFLCLPEASGFEGQPETQGSL